MLNGFEAFQKVHRMGGVVVRFAVVHPVSFAAQWTGLLSGLSLFYSVCSHDREEGGDRAPLPHPFRRYSPAGRQGRTMTTRQQPGEAKPTHGWTTAQRTTSRIPSVDILLLGVKVEQ